MSETIASSLMPPVSRVPARRLDPWPFDGEWKASMNCTPAGEFLGATVTRIDADDPDVTYWLAAHEHADQVLQPF